MKNLTLLDEVKDFFRFFSIDKEDREIVFYSETAGDISFFGSVINELIETHSKKIYYITSDPSDPLLSSERKNLETFYSKKLLGLFIKMLDSKLLVMTMSGLGCFHIKPSRRGVNHVYLFHNIGSSFPVIRHGELFHYNTMFTVGQHHDEEIKKQEEIYNLPKKSLVPFGYPKLDEVYKKFKEYDKSDQLTGRILIAPGWGKWDKRDSLLDVCGKELIERLLDANYEVILRPHPMTRIKFPEFLDDLYRAFEGHENFHHEENIASLDSFFNADLMISDWSGVVYEFAFGTEKPVLFIDTPFKVNNPKYQEVGEPVDIKLRERLGKVIKPEEIHNVVSSAEELIKNADQYKNEIIRARNELVYNFGSSAEKGAKALIRLSM